MVLGVVALVIAFGLVRPALRSAAEARGKPDFDPRLRPHVRNRMRPTAPTPPDEAGRQPDWCRPRSISMRCRTSRRSALARSRFGPSALARCFEGGPRHPAQAPDRGTRGGNGRHTPQLDGRRRRGRFKMMRALILEDFAQPETSARLSGPDPHFAVPDAPPPEGVQQEAETVGLDRVRSGLSQRAGTMCIANETEERRRDRRRPRRGPVRDRAHRRDRAEGASCVHRARSRGNRRAAASADGRGGRGADPFVEEIRTIVAGQDPLGLEVLASPQKCTPPSRRSSRPRPSLPSRWCRNPHMPRGRFRSASLDQRRDIDLSEAAARMAEIIRAFAAGTDTAKPQFGSVPRHADRGVA